VSIIHTGGTSWLAYKNGQGILIDAGRQPNAAGIIRRIGDLGIKVPLLFLTHTHYDHTGGAEAIRRATGAAVAVGREEADMLREGYTPVPKGTGRLGRALVGISKAVTPESRARYRPVNNDITEISETGSLDGYGFDMQVFRLGGHTAGSIGLKIGDEFFAGDVVFGVGGVIYPPFGDRPEEFQAAWKIILDSGSNAIYPGHGRPFSAYRLEKEYHQLFQ